MTLEKKYGFFDSPKKVFEKHRDFCVFKLPLSDFFFFFFFVYFFFKKFFFFFTQTNLKKKYLNEKKMEKTEFLHDCPNLANFCKIKNSLNF